MATPTNVLMHMQDKAEAMASLHNAASNFYRRLSIFISVPAIILAAVGGSASIADSSSRAVSIAFGCLSLSAAILLSMLRYLSCNELQARHSIFGKLAAALCDHIRLHMSLDQVQLGQTRTFTSLEELAKDAHTRMDMIASGQPSVPAWIVRKYESKKQASHAKPCV